MRCAVQSTRDFCSPSFRHVSISQTSMFETPLNLENIVWVKDVNELQKSGLGAKAWRFVGRG